MWFGVAPPSPSRLSRALRLEEEQQQTLPSPRRAAAAVVASSTAGLARPSRQRGAAASEKKTTPRRRTKLQEDVKGREDAGRSRPSETLGQKLAQIADQSQRVVDNSQCVVADNSQSVADNTGATAAASAEKPPQQRSGKESEVRDAETAAERSVHRPTATTENQADCQDGHEPVALQLSSRARRSSVHRVTPTGSDGSKGSNNSSLEWSTAPVPFVSLRPEHLVGHTSSVCSLVAHDGRFIVSCSVDGAVKVWSQATFECLHTIYGHQDAVSCVDLNARWLVSGSHDCTLRLYCTSSSFDLLHVLRGHLGHVTQVRFPASLPSYVVSCSDDYTLCLWNAERGECILELRTHLSRVTCFAVQRERICSGAADGTVCFWDISLLDSNHGQPMSQYISSARIYYAHKSTVQCIVDMGSRTTTASRVNSGDCSVVVSGSNDGTIQLFSAETFAHLGRLDTVGSPVYAMAALSNGRLLCSTKDGRLLHYGNLLRPASRKAPAVLQLTTKWISSLQVCGDLVACSSEEALYIVDTTHMCMVLVFETQHSFITCTRWIHKTALITAGQDNVIKMWPIALPATKS